MENRFFERNRYEKGMLLTAEDQECQQAYHVEKRRLLNLSTIGTGVVNGFSLEIDDDGTGLSIAAGLALDSAGREIYLPEPLHKTIDELFPDLEPDEDCYCLSVGYVESAVGEAAVLPQQDGNHPVVPNRIREFLKVAVSQTVPADGIELAELCLKLQDGKPIIANLVSSNRTFHSALFSTKGTASGVISVNLNVLPDGDEIYYSQEVSHGLGPGANISVTTAVLDDDGDAECVISGSPELFGCPYRTAVKLFPERGTFIAAVRSHSMKNGFLHLRWYARKMDNIGEKPIEKESAPEETAPEIRPAEPAALDSAENARLLLKPSVVFLQRGQITKFIPVFPDQSVRRTCRFQVTDIDGGTIDSDGIYTAPDRTGVFGIAASVDGFPELTANALACILSEKPS